MKKNFILTLLCTMLFIFGCSCASSKMKLTDSTVVKSTSESWSPTISFRGNGLIYCESDGDDYVFEIHARHGSFLIERDDRESFYVTDIVIEGSGYAYWQYDSVSYPVSSSLTWAGLKTFLEVFIRKNNQYVGYAVVTVERPEDIWTYSATVIECKEVLQQEDSTNGLSKETLQQMIDNVINKY